jgi:hypothetical protein
MAKEKEDRTVGLRAIGEGRADRARGKFSRATPGLTLFAAAGIAITLIIYSHFTQKTLDADKTALLAKQRAAIATVGANWFPIRDHLEKITIDSAKDFSDDDFIAPDAAKFDFRSMPGIYLRLRVADAHDVEKIREQSQESSRDAFCGCLLKEPNDAAAKGYSDAGGAPLQPWNMWEAYQATRVLSDSWTADVRESTDDLRLRVFKQQYEKATTEDIPLSIDIIKRARFFLLVLDEDVHEAKAKADGGAISEEILQTVPHDTRVRVVNMQTWEDIARMKRTGVGELISVGEHAPEDPETHDAMTRQMQNCSLAMQVSRAIGFDKDRAAPQ